MKNVVITGFMGTGKTTVGREVARLLGRPFLDMDAEIEATAGKSVGRIFAEDGEETFRQMEARMCAELSAQQGLVIASGGGTLVDAANRAQMMANSTVVCLTCSVDEILLRLLRSGNPARPLLEVADPRAQIEQLLQARQEAYEAIPWQIDTTGLDVEAVSARVLEIANGICLPVSYPGGEYSIHVGRGLLQHTGGLVRATGLPADGLVALVANPLVGSLYGAWAISALQSARLRPFVCSIPDGEQYKNLSTVGSLYDQFLVAGLDRSGAVLALGGGVTGDVAGFAAATFMRGVPVIQVPTTLLAMVDASVGGKTGVDLPQGKNLVGAFKQPALVLVDPAVLATLPVQELECGVAEVIKHALIGDMDLFAALEAGAGNLEFLQGAGGAAWIARALRVKIQIVEQDPFEQAHRAVLNLGHTLGHALEALSGFRLRHGHAVSIGMVAAARIATEMGLADPLLVERLEGVLAAWGLPVRCPPVDFAAIYQALAHDKKRQNRKLRWVLPRSIGQVEVVEDVPLDVVECVLRGMGAGDGAQTRGN